MALIAKGAYVNAKDKYGNIPLHLAIEKGYTDIAIELIDAGAKINTIDISETISVFILR